MVVEAPVVELGSVMAKDVRWGRFGERCRASNATAARRERFEGVRASERLLEKCEVTHKRMDFNVTLPKSTRTMLVVV